MYIKMLRKKITQKLINILKYELYFVASKKNNAENRGKKNTEQNLIPNFLFIKKKNYSAVDLLH